MKQVVETKVKPQLMVIGNFTMFTRSCPTSLLRMGVVEVLT